MRMPRLWTFVLLILAVGTASSQWSPGAERARLAVGADLVYARRTATRATDGKELTAHLALFHSRSFRLEVVDLGDGAEPIYPGLPEAFRAQGCVAGVNGGFFHPDWRPAGLMVAQGRRSSQLESARLLSGVIYADPSGITLVRRARFRDHPGIKALLQAGPYLVEGGRAVRGLSAADPNRRTFIATDWRGHWAIGATPSPLSLSELAECLATPGALIPWGGRPGPELGWGLLDRVLLRPWARPGPGDLVALEAGA